MGFLGSSIYRQVMCTLRLPMYAVMLCAVLYVSVPSHAIIKSNKSLQAIDLQSGTVVKNSRYNINKNIFGYNKQKGLEFKDNYTENGLLDTFSIYESIVNDPMFYQGEVLPPMQSYVTSNDVSVSIADAYNHRILEIDPHSKKIIWDYGRVGTYSMNRGYLHYPSFVEKIGSALFLVTDLGNNRIIKLKKGDDGFGEIVWSYGDGEMGRGDNQVFLAETATELPGGNILVTDTSNHRIIEVNKKGKVVWQYGNFDRGTGFNWLDSPQGSSLTADPHQILIADTGNHRIIIVDKSTKKILWQYGTTAKPGIAYGYLDLPNAAREIFGGNILITDSANHRVIEVDRKTKKILWQYGDGTPGSGFNELDWPYNAYRLPNGNTFITDSDNQRVIEVDHYHRIVWQYGRTDAIGSGYDMLYAPYDAQITAMDKSYATDENLDTVLDIADNTDTTELDGYLTYDPMKEIGKSLFVGDKLSIELSYDYPCKDLSGMELAASDDDISDILVAYSFQGDDLAIMLDDAYPVHYMADYQNDIDSWIYDDKLASMIKDDTPDEYADIGLPPNIQTPLLMADNRLQYTSQIGAIGEFSVFDSMGELDKYMLMNYLSLRLSPEFFIDSMEDHADYTPVGTQTAYSYYPVSDYSISYLIRSYDYVNIEPLKNLEEEYSQQLAQHNYNIRDI